MARALLSGEIEELLCKSCFQLPKGIVYQCKNGHPLCTSCHQNHRVCPKCRTQLDKENPRRNLFIEKHLEKRTGELSEVEGNEPDEAPEDHHCPICFNLPEQEVFQCINGHYLCAACHDHEVMQTCSQCRKPFDKVDPIRNFVLEALLDKYLFRCAYEVNGCPHQTPRKLLKNHQRKCNFNIKRFGQLIKLCKQLGHEGCDFCVNYGNIKDFVKHLITAHGCDKTEAKHLRIELSGFQEATKATSAEICVWTPVILDLKEKKCYLLISAIFNPRIGSLSCFSIYLPKCNQSITDLKMQYSVAGQNVDYLEWKITQSCIPLSKADSLLPRNLPCTILPPNLQSHFTNEGSLAIDCILQDGHRNDSNQATECKLERIVSTTKTIPSNLLSLYDFEQSQEVVTNSGELFNPQNGLINNANICVKDLPEFATKVYIKNFFSDFGEIVSVKMIPQSRSNGQGNVSKSCIVSFKHRASVHKIIDRKDQIFMESDGGKHQLVVAAEKLTRITETEEKAYIDKAYEVRTDRNALMEYVMEAFSSTGDWNVRQRLTCWMSFLAANYGSLESLKYCIEKGIDTNLSQHKPNDITERHMSLLSLTVCDTDPKSGLEKAKYLIENGADIHFKDDRGGSLLHYSVTHGSVDMVKFFLNKGVDVNACFEYGSTALHTALIADLKIRSLVEKIRILLDHGASLKIKDYMGRCPWNDIRWAPVVHRNKIKEMFRNHL